VSLDPRLRKFLRVALIGAGALTMLSAIVNIFAAWKLVDDSAEESLGITRGDWVTTYGALLVIGATMVTLGVRWKK